MKPGRWRRVRLALVRLHATVRRHVRAVLARSVARKHRTQEDYRDLDARARFWAEFREGQDEAAARSERRKS
jgi:hypothetical protein